MQWRRLDILSTSRGGPLDSEGTVEFKAHFRHDGERGVHHETSRFPAGGPALVLRRRRRVRLTRQGRGATGVQAAVSGLAASD